MVPVVKFPQGASIETIEGAVPGTAGELNLFYKPAQATDWKMTGWEKVDSKRDFTFQFKLTNLEPDSWYLLKIECRVSAGSEKGQTSIEVFALNRNGLVDARNDRIREILGQARSVIDWLDELKNTGDSQNRRRKLARSIKELHKYGIERKEFAGMARQLIARIEENAFRRYAIHNLSSDLQLYLDQLLSQAEWRN